MVQTRWGHMNRDALAAHARAGADARRPPPRREPRALRRAGWLFNFSGTGGIWRTRGDRDAPAAGSTTRSPRISTSPTARSSPAGASSTARTSSRPPSCPRTSARSARSSSAGPRARCRRRASCMKRVLCVRAHAHAARRGVLPHDAALRLPAHGAAQRAAPAGARAHAGDEHARRCCIIDLPLCIGDDGLARRVLRDGRGGAGAAARSTRSRSCPRSSRSAPASPRTSRRPCFEGLRSMAGEFVRTPKQGDRTRAATARAADLPLVEMALCLALVRARRRLARDRPLVRDAVRRCSSRSATATSPSSSPASRLAPPRGRPPVDAGTPSPWSRRRRARARRRRSEPPPASGEQWVAEPASASDMAA